MPPSTNKLYQKRRGGGLALSETAKKFERGVKKVIAANSEMMSAFPVDPELVYQFELALYFEKLENPGWFDVWSKDGYYTKDSKDGKHKKGELKHRAGERKAKTRYKRVDYDNRIKFLQDCIAKSVGIDDSQIFRGIPEKRESPNERAVVRMMVIDRDQFFRERRKDG